MTCGSSACQAPCVYSLIRPAWDPVVYLADFASQVLFPLAADHAEQDVAGTMAGRAFTTGQPVTSPRDGSVRVWVPVVEQTTRTGVLAVTVPDASAQVRAQVESLGVFAGLVVASAVRVSDVPYVRRRGRAMSLPAGMQWDLLPPLSARTPGALIAGVLEPAYDIAGDAFDYAVNGADLHFAIFDGLGHGIGSTLLTGLAVGAYRHARRAGAPVAGLHAAVEAALAGYYDDVLVRHRHHRPPGYRVRAAGVVVCRASAAAAAARPQGGRRAQQRPGAAVRARRSCPRAGH